MSIATVAPSIEPWKIGQERVERYVAMMLSNVGNRVEANIARTGALEARVSRIEDVLHAAMTSTTATVGSAEIETVNDGG